MKYRRPKIKYQHHMITGLRELLESIEAWEEIITIIPARINRTKTNRSGINLKVQYATKTGLKCIAQAAGTTQEVFIISENVSGLQEKFAQWRLAEEHH